ncbi:MAG: hypothetical protein KF708_15660 [Pirellulales bacterium]|nr:hypothetical protein [Pirellulales bacterium]
MSKAPIPAPDAGMDREAASGPGAATATVPRSQRSIGVLGIVSLVLVLTTLQFALLAYLQQHRTAARLEPEFSLGTFRYEEVTGASDPIRAAQFELHIDLLPEVDREARLRLTARRFKVQQGIEELLRRARGREFEDPALAELKRMLKEQINASLGLRSIGEIIITDLKLTRGAAMAVTTPHETEPPYEGEELDSSPTKVAQPSDSDRTSSL